MRVQLKTNYLANDFATVQTKNTYDNSKPNFESTFRFSKRGKGSWLLMKGLRDILESFEPKTIMNTNTKGEFSNHLLVSFSKEKDAEVMRALQTALANENEVRCNHISCLHDLTEEELSSLHFDRMPVYSFIKPMRQQMGNPFKSAPIVPIEQYAMAS